MKRIAELDGVRGVAILAVLGVHTGTLRGGNHGVDIFFTLSGFLITSILLLEFDGTDNISLSRFYARRALRLFPALFVYVAACALWAIKEPEIFAISPKTAIASALFYFANWVLAFGPSSGEPTLGPLAHFWSLSIEEQFYFTWPLFLLVAFKLRIRRSVIAYTALAVAILSVAERLYLRHEGASILRIYMGTDTRADGLLIGCACAFVRDRINIPRRLGLAACWIIAFLLFTTPWASTYWVWGSFFVASACTGIVLLSVTTEPDIALRSIVGSQTLIYFGQRSYSLYLWHYVFTHYLLLRLEALPVPAAIALVLALSLCAAELSYRLIEQPFLKFKDRNRSNLALLRHPARMT